MGSKYRQFRPHRAHEATREGITVKTVLGSVATVATTQQLADETVDRICILVYDIIGEVQSYHFRSRRTSGGL
jgi:hypothetical protein